MHPGFRHQMTWLIAVAWAELAWIALPGGAYFDGQPLTAVLITALVCWALWKRIRLVWWLCVAYTTFSIVQLTLFATGELGVVGPLLAFEGAKLALLLGYSIRSTTRRTYRERSGRGQASVSPNAISFPSGSR
jgi:hypothetical protein